jgi:hypothetical protein
MYQDRDLKHRAKTATRRVLVRPELVKPLDAHCTRVWRPARADALPKAQQDSHYLCGHPHRR